MVCGGLGVAELDAELAGLAQLEELVRDWLDFRACTGSSLPLIGLFGTRYYALAHMEPNFLKSWLIVM